MFFFYQNKQSYQTEVWCHLNCINKAIHVCVLCLCWMCYSEAKDIVRPRIPMQSCLEAFGASEVVEGFYSSAINATCAANKYDLWPFQRVVMVYSWFCKKCFPFLSHDIQKCSKKMLNIFFVSIKQTAEFNVETEKDCDLFYINYAPWFPGELVSWHSRTTWWFNWRSSLWERTGCPKSWVGGGNVGLS